MSLQNLIENLQVPFLDLTFGGIVSTLRAKPYEPAKEPDLRTMKEPSGLFLRISIATSQAQPEML